MSDLNTSNIVNCWNSIGVWGRERPRCPVLDSVLHCYNCDKYIAAGRKALEKTVPKDHEAEWNKVLNKEKSDEEKNTFSNIIFSICNAWYALPTFVFQKIAVGREIHSIPHNNNPNLEGIVNIDGKIQLCFSMENLLGCPREGHGEEKRDAECSLVILESNGKSYVIKVNKIEGIFKSNKNKLESVESHQPLQESRFSAGIILWEGKKVVYLKSDVLFSALERSTF